MVGEQAKEWGVTWSDAELPRLDRGESSATDEIFDYTLSNRDSCPREFREECRGPFIGTVDLFHGT